MPYKYRKTDNGLNWMLNDIDTPLYRYAEAILIYAEAQNELGNSATAITYVNMIRARARQGTGAESRAEPHDYTAAELPDQGAVSGLYARAQYRARVDDRAGPDAAVRADDGRMLTGLRAPRRYPDPGARLDNGTLAELYAREDVRLVGHQANLPAWSNGCTGAPARQCSSARSRWRRSRSRW